jgi:hypothetical protein
MDSRDARCASHEADGEHGNSDRFCRELDRPTSASTMILFAMFLLLSQMTIPSSDASLAAVRAYFDLPR